MKTRQRSLLKSICRSLHTMMVVTHLVSKQQYVHVEMPLPSIWWVQLINLWFINKIPNSYECCIIVPAHKWYAEFWCQNSPGCGNLLLDWTLNKTTTKISFSSSLLRVHFFISTKTSLWLTNVDRDSTRHYRT